MAAPSFIFRLLLAVFVATWTPLSCCCTDMRAAVAGSPVSLASAEEHTCCHHATASENHSQARHLTRCSDETPASQHNDSWPCSKSCFDAGPAEQSSAMAVEFSADHMTWFMQVLLPLDVQWNLASHRSSDKPIEDASPPWQRSLWSQRCSMLI